MTSLKPVINVSLKAHVVKPPRDTVDWTYQVTVGHETEDGIVPPLGVDVEQ